MKKKKFEIDESLGSKYCRCNICGNEEYISIRTNYRDNNGFIVRMCKECRDDMVKFFEEVDKIENS